MNWVSQLKNNDEWAFEQVFLANKEKVFRYFLKKTGSVSDAEDLLQNTFLKLWRYRSSLNEAFLLDQQLFTIARSVFIDHTRNRNKLKKIEALVKREIARVKEEIADGADKEQLSTILEKMPELRKKVFIMHKIEGYSYKEIAEQLCINIKAVDNHIARALKQIRRSLLAFFCSF